MSILLFDSVAESISFIYCGSLNRYKYPSIEKNQSQKTKFLINDTYVKQECIIRSSWAKVNNGWLF